MADKIVLVSDDIDFFDYIKPKLELRKSDELFCFSFEALIDKIYSLDYSLVIINSENAKEKTIDLLKLFKGLPSVVFTFNDDDVFRRNCYRLGAAEFLTVLTTDAEFRARLIPLLNMSAVLKKSAFYRNILVKNKIISERNEVYIDYNNLIQQELDRLKVYPQKAIFMAISPNNNDKFLLEPMKIEAVILENIRQNDILLNFAPNKYFLIMYDLDLDKANKVWEKISKKLQGSIYAGFCNITNQTKEELINDALNKLHRAINLNKNNLLDDIEPISKLVNIENSQIQNLNFKMFRQGFKDKIKQIIIPVFYLVQQRYLNKLAGVNLEQGIGDGYGIFYIKYKNLVSSFRISSPGFSKIHIDITYQIKQDEVDTKRISLEPEEFEKELLENLLEQFVLEYMKGVQHDS